MNKWRKFTPPLVILLAICLLLGLPSYLRKSAGSGPTSDDRQKKLIIDRTNIDVISNHTKDTRSGSRSAQKNVSRVMRDIDIAEATSSMIDSLAKDEASRATLISEKESEESHQYIFEIARNPDLDNLIDDLFEENSEEYNIDIAALKTNINPMIGRFHIAEGMTQKLWVTVPKNRDEKVTFIMATSAEGDDVINDGDVQLSGQPIFGEVSRSKPGWIYNKILDIDL